jgi:hypothetical protein
VVLASDPTRSAPPSINNVVYYGLLCTAIAFIIVILIDAWTLLRGARRQQQQ